VSFTTSLVKGIAQHLADVGVGQYRGPGVAFQPGDKAIALKALPPDPDRAIALTIYPVSAGHGWDGEVELGLQVRCRGSRSDVTDVDDLADAVYEALHGLAGTFGGVTTPGIFHQSGAPIGPDGNGRSERTDNYYLRAAHATASLI
jgi:hypothetical protein